MLAWGLLMLTAAVYWPGLQGPMLLDDFENLEPLMDMQSGRLAWHEVLGGFSIHGRPISMLSFVANWLTSAGELWSLKYTNLMIHLLCGALLFWLAGRLLGEPRAGVAAQRWWIAEHGALCGATHGAAGDVVRARRPALLRLWPTTAGGAQTTGYRSHMSLLHSILAACRPQ
jgi:hypothetical protein